SRELDAAGLRPAGAAVIEDPAVDRVAFHAEADLVAVGEPSVDLPLAVAALELEVARDARRLVRGRQVEEVRLRGGVDAAVGHHFADVGLRQLVAPAPPVQD